MLLALLKYADLKWLVGLDINLRNGLRTSNLFRQTVSLLTLSPPLSSQSMDEGPHILWYCYHPCLLYSNIRDVRGTLYSKTRRNLDGVRLFPSMWEEHYHDVCSRHIQRCQRLLSLTLTDPCGLEPANAASQKDRGLDNFHDRPIVSFVQSNTTLRTVTHSTYSACIASVLGLYYRVLLARRGDFTWREIQVGSLV